MVIFQSVAGVFLFSPTIPKAKAAIRPTATDKNGNGIPFGYSTTLTFRNGLATSDIKLYKGETAYINITDGTYSSFNNKTYAFP